MKHSMSKKTSSSLWYCSSALPIFFVSALFIMPKKNPFKNLSKIPLHHGALNMLNFHSIICRLRKLKSSSSWTVFLSQLLPALKVFALPLITVLGVPRLAINSFSVYFNSSVNIDLDSFKCTALVVAQMNFTMYPFIS